MKGKFKKGFLILVVCLVFIQVIVMAAGPSPDAKSWGNQFIIGVKILDSDSNPISEIPINAGFKVSYEWRIPNDEDVYEGDTMQVTLPSELQTAPNQQLDFKDANGNTVARGQATVAGSNQYEVTFTDYPETHSNVSGYFEFFVKFSDEVQPGDPVDIVFDIPGGSVVIPITPEEPGDPGEPGNPGDPGDPAGDKFYKTGYYTENGTIEWFITIIPPKLKSDPGMPGYYDPLFNVVVNDSYSQGQELIENTVKVRNAYLLEGNPQAIPSGDFSPIGVTDLDLNNRTFSVNLGDLDDGYGRQITYETRITDPEIETYSNDVSVTAQDFDREGGATVRIEGGEGGAGGEQAGFSVMKEDSNNNPLPGAKFTLSRITSSGATEIATGLESGPDGKISYPQTLKFGTYQLVETEAPDGFQLLSDPYEFTLDSAGIKELTIPIVNKAEVGSVTLLKHEAGDEGKVLEGAKFMLYSGVAPNGTPIDEYETGPDGKITVNNLAFGSYYFVETVAPNGYEENTEPQPFTIGEGQVEVPFDLKVPNTKLPDPVGSVTLLKHEAGDEGKVLEGAKFMLYSGVAPNGTPIDEYETGPDGKITVNNLAFGSYYFVETVAPNGYEENTEPQAFTIGEGQVEVPFDLKVPNTKLPDPVGSVTLLKHEAGDEGKVLEGAKFMLYSGVAPNGTPIDEYETGPDGKITVNNLAFGPYYFLETVAPNGYEENKEPQAFTIGEGQVEVPFDLKVPNTKLPDPVGSVTLLKHEAGDEGKVLEGAKFMLYSGVAPNGTPIDEYETGPDGKITVNNLAFGPYYFVETVAPSGYEENTEPQAFTIGEGQVEVPFDLKVPNTKLPDPVGSVTLLKHEAGDEGKVLEGAKFMLYSGVAPNGIPMNEYETGPDGKITVNNLAFGSYYFVETVAPSGYEENTEPQPFTIGEGQVEVPFDLKVPNTKLPDPVGSVELLKQDGATKQALQGARFELYQGTSEEPGDLVGTYTTGADGKLKVDNLLYGDYHFVEVQAPDRYITDGKPINFAINSSTTTVELTMDNVKDYQPQIQTLAFETGTNKKQLYPGMATQISDRVSYQELTPGKSYRLEAKLMTKDGQKTLTQGTRTFTATSENGEETVALDAFDARALKGQQVVVFEQVIDVATSDVVARHESLNDADQTVTFLVPSLQTFAFETGTDGQYGLYPHPDLKLSDRVVYTNLNPGERYTLEATLVDKVDGALVFTQGTHSFIPETASGEVAVPLDTFDATSLKGNSYVVFEVLKDEDGQIIADHRDTDSLTQGISFVTPTIKTNATDKATGEHEVLPGPITIVDNVSYTNLDPSRTYQLSGVLMDKATGAPLIVDGSTVTATKTFQPESTEGFTALEFDVDTSDLKGKDIVVFETLTLDGVVVAIEKNINEESQTIKVANPTIRTTLQDKETGTQNPSPEEDITLVDTIHYEDLLVGREYTVKGTLMDKTTKAPLLVDGEKVEAEATFTPETTSGDVEVTFTFNAKGLAGKDIVAFESLYAAGQLIAKHEDFDDENQTVQFKKPDLQTVAADTDGSKDIEPTDKQVVDLVNYKDLIPGKEYTVKGKLMDKATGNSVLIAGKEVLGETTFTPEESNGSVEVYFNLDARELAGRDIVVFEKLYRNGKEVVTHEDINDVSQTVTFTKQPTTKPEPPNNNPSTNKPGTPSTPGISGTTGSAGTNKKNSTLPGTGDTTAPYDILIGILLVASGTVLLRKRRQ